MNTQSLFIPDEEAPATWRAELQSLHCPRCTVAGDAVPKFRTLNDHSPRCHKRSAYNSTASCRRNTTHPDQKRRLSRSALQANTQSVHYNREAHFLPVIKTQLTAGSLAFRSFIHTPHLRSDAPRHRILYYLQIPKLGWQPFLQNESSDPHQPYSEQHLETGL